MATKKSTTKRTTKAAKPTTRAKAARTTRAKTTTRVVKKKPAKMRSFHVAKQTKPFMSTKLTVQTLYWIVIGIVVITSTVWILKIQDDISKIYDSIDAANTGNVIETPVNHKAMGHGAKR